ncbi:hypothetical protein GCM10027425_02370 [Alteromonas gracilis]
MMKTRIVLMAAAALAMTAVPAAGVEVKPGESRIVVGVTNQEQADGTIAQTGERESDAAKAPDRYIPQPLGRPSCAPGQGVAERWVGGPTNEVETVGIQLNCFGDPADPDPAVPAAAAPAPPQITQAMVRRAFEQVPVPELSSQTQPVDKTLVNFDTIFYVDAQPMTETVTLLGQQVTLFIEPSTYRWDHGDGSEVTTYSPGAAYPSKEIVHRYTDARQTVRHQVSIDWTATYSVNGGPAQPVPGTVTTVGPETPLRISEAAPALSGDHSG